jgi:hypothetical protein
MISGQEVYVGDSELSSVDPLSYAPPVTPTFYKNKILST